MSSWAHSAFICLLETLNCSTRCQPNVKMHDVHILCMLNWQNDFLICCSILKKNVPIAIVRRAAPGLVGKVAGFQRSLSSHRSGLCRFHPALATSGTSQVLLAGAPDGFPGVLPFRSTYSLARLDMSDNIERDVLLFKKPIGPMVL